MSKVLDESTGGHYYYNSLTGETSWSKPALFGSEVSLNHQRDERGWKEMCSICDVEMIMLSVAWAGLPMPCPQPKLAAILESLPVMRASSPKFVWRRSELAAVACRDAGNNINSCLSLTHGMRLLQDVESYPQVGLLTEGQGGEDPIGTGSYGYDQSQVRSE